MNLLMSGLHHMEILEMIIIWGLKKILLLYILLISIDNQYDNWMIYKNKLYGRDTWDICNTCVYDFKWEIIDNIIYIELNNIKFKGKIF